MLIQFFDLGIDGNLMKHQKILCVYPWSDYNSMLKELVVVCFLMVQYSLCLLTHSEVYCSYIQVCNLISDEYFLDYVLIKDHLQVGISKCCSESVVVHSILILEEYRDLDW